MPKMELTLKLSICISCTLWNASSSDEFCEKITFYFEKTSSQVSPSSLTVIAGTFDSQFSMSYV